MWAENVLLKIFKSNKGTLKIENKKGAILSALAEFHGRNGKIHPSHKKLALCCSCHPDTIKRNLKELKESGYVKIERRGYKTNSYKIEFPKLIDDLNLHDQDLSKLLRLTGTSTDFYLYKNNTLNSPDEGVMRGGDGAKCATNKEHINNNNITIEREPASLSHAPDFSPIEELMDLDRYELMSRVENLERELNAIVEKSIKNSQPLAEQAVKERVEEGRGVPHGTLPVRKITSKIKGIHKLYSKKSRIPTDFSPTEENKEVAKRLGVDISKTWSKFVNYHIANGSIRPNWDKQFNIWIEKEVEFNKKQPVWDKTMQFDHVANELNMLAQKEAIKERLTVKPSTPESIEKRESAIAEARRSAGLKPRNYTSALSDLGAISKIEKALGCGLGRQGGYV